MPTAAETEALLLSLRVATVATLMTIVPGICVAWILARTEFRAKVLLDAVVSSTLVLPPVVTGYFLLAVFGKNGPVGALLDRVFGFSFAFSWQGAALASALVAFPLFVRTLRVSLESVDSSLEDAARILGAGRLRTALRITLPLAAPGLLAGAVLAFARSLGEFGATITFVGNIAGETRTVPLAIYAYTQTPGYEGAAFKLALLSFVVAVVALVGSEWVAARIRRRTREERTGGSRHG
jgi:molybdate transport system permease protein